VNSTDPLIWFEHGLGGSHLDFAWVQKYVTDTKLGRWCSNDHAGLGLSSLGRFPRGTEKLVQELQALLTAKGINDDLLIVGHSMAGYNTRVAQRLIKSNKIAGLVLVDPVDTQYNDYECTEDSRFPNPILRIASHINSTVIVRSRGYGKWSKCYGKS
jgi:pimeloyl-ACP methyl ester carboxylesterase